LDIPGCQRWNLLKEQAISLLMLNKFQGHMVNINSSIWPV